MSLNILHLFHNIDNYDNNNDNKYNSATLCETVMATLMGARLCLYITQCYSVTLCCYVTGFCAADVTHSAQDVNTTRPAQISHSKVTCDKC